MYVQHAGGLYHIPNDRIGHLPCTGKHSNKFVEALKKFGTMKIQFKIQSSYIIWKLFTLKLLLNYIREITDFVRK